MHQCGTVILLLIALMNHELHARASLTSLNLLSHKMLHRNGASKAASGRNVTRAVDEPKAQSKISDQTITKANKAGPRTLPVLAPPPPDPSTPHPRFKRLDIVLMHYHSNTVLGTLEYWLDFLKSDKVQQWEPYVFLNCQNDNKTLASELAPLLRNGGEIVHLPNVGRESHAYLQHIIKHYHDLADYTIFSQAIPEAPLKQRFEMMFDNHTGFLPLSHVAHVDCKDGWLPPGIIAQVYSMLTRALCPPEGFTWATEGQFLVSRKRIQAQDWWVYKHLLDLLTAPVDHWIHAEHDNDFYKNENNPFFGHIMERSWSLMFNCFESWRQGNCYWCEQDMFMVGCGKDACQCFDTLPEGVT